MFYDLLQSPGYLVGYNYLIATFELEAYDVIIMLQSVIVDLYNFSIAT